MAKISLKQYFSHLTDKIPIMNFILPSHESVHHQKDRKCITFLSTGLAEGIRPPYIWLLVFFAQFMIEKIFCFFTILFYNIDREFHYRRIRP